MAKIRKIHSALNKFYTDFAEGDDDQQDIKREEERSKKIREIMVDNSLSDEKMRLLLSDSEIDDLIVQLKRRN